MKTKYTYIKSLSIVYFLVNLLTYNSSAQDAVNNMPPPPGFGTRIDYLKSFTNENDAVSAYRKGLITKNEVMMAHLLVGNLKRQDFYGKVVDQNGQPVAGANIIGYLRTDKGFGINDEKVEELKTQTDAGGLFQFEGVRGARFGQKVSKDGYEMRDEGYKRQNGLETSPDDRVTFIMWKLKGPEPMAHSHIHAYVPCDGNITRFDLLTGKKTADGDLIASITRDPLNIIRGRPFNWSLTLEIPSGGVCEITNIYPYVAPADGYQRALKLNFQTNAAGWLPSFDHAYYFKSKDGQIYGRISVNVQADFQPPPTYFGVEIYANPASSRNLEFDYKKQVR